MITSQPTQKTSQASLAAVDAVELGVARAHDAFFEAVHDLWLVRYAEGMKKKDIATFLDKDPAWVSRAMAGPGNWTIETFAGLVEALDGLIDLKILPRDKIRPSTNYDAYAATIDGAVHSHCPLTMYAPNFIDDTRSKSAGANTFVATITPMMMSSSQQKNISSDIKPALTPVGG